MSGPHLVRDPRPLQPFASGRRIRSASNGCFLKSFRDAMVVAHGCTCVYCGDRAEGEEASIDHVVPVAAGGTDDLPNLVLACRPCNYGKGSRSLQEFRVVLAIRFSPLAGIVTGPQALRLIQAGATLPINLDFRFWFEEALEAMT